MPRPKIKRHLRFQPNCYYYKPRGIPLSELEEIAIQKDEIEAIKLYEVDNLDQTLAASRMKISQPTFARILNNAHKKIAEAIIKGKAIRIEK
ncbi:hypothetical protein A2X44_04690 [candidate division CPR3 bacterium GWF2_35_18]|uniref:UPF0251 protein UR67_C0003G0020 n=1 Tax=candidate division CPR3 bacterium GW2011_GWF2_35_18 TaxID=1618350 RepID=A0A0G0ER17_UNCC3|nr:MAG: hypothetical protein UR67_C0003G0020 [candidate division CPR3 bacterium GW2011_GWF2_35_18]KKP86206.1 MAG: hypothetical protein UR87_C0026G0008 [candidate division CPR3 bacterium GW2011_GWE2_35_7]OGB63632.1 MAG: hypothetical protein A2X44_04690 [candidate division CPR3 bacterium GWF2_35_18]OGB64173.1 MAG: hypothetical protein A2250_02555 [candidate division CPR3 bacterium RIFOXYA2_FULL_35_13]OGB76139.1 MAG: hypothetical protein A2476_02235 [candidate division CPR3 bacterium RIFOXYC2_FULL